MIKNIVFDFGGVLVQYDFIAFFAHYLGNKEKAEWFMQNVLPQEVNDDMDRELHSFRFYIEQQQRKWPEYAELLDIFDKHYSDVFTMETKGMRQLMTELKSRGFHLLGLSNWSSRIYDVMAKFDIFSFLEGSVISKDVHLLKPDREIYDFFLHKFNLDANDCIFIDDKSANIEGAKVVGMKGVVFKNVEQLKKELEEKILI